MRYCLAHRARRKLLSADIRYCIFFVYSVILLENGKRITVDLNTVTVVAEAAASGGVAPIITPLVVGAVTAAIPFVPGVGPVVGGLVSSGLGLASIAVPAALRAMRGQNQSDAHGHQ